MVFAKKIQFSIFVLSLAFITDGCLDQIDFEIEESLADALVIEGTLRKGNPSSARVTITRLFDFGAGSLQPVNVREVLLLDQDGNSIKLEEFGSGVYEALISNSEDLVIAAGKEYRLQVSTFDNRRIISTPEPLISATAPGNVSTSLFKKEFLGEDGQIYQEDYLGFEIETPIVTSSEGKPMRYFWNLEQTYLLTDSPDRNIENGKKCYISQPVDISRVKILDAADYFGATQVTAPLYETQANFVFAEGFYLTVEQQSLSEGAYQYWNQISQVIDRTGNMFEAPAGTIFSNFVNVEDGTRAEKIYGYFYAVETMVNHYYVSPEEAGSPNMFCPWPADQIPPPSGCPRFPCCECLDDPNATIEKPSFWTK